MGLISEVGGLKKEYRQARKEAQEATKKAEELRKKLDKKKEKEENQKIYERDLEKAVAHDLRHTFEKCFERDGLEKGFINLSLKATRDEILNNIPESDIEWHYINENYEKILNKIKKIYENDQKAKNYIINMQTEQEKIKNTNKTILINILYNICAFIFSPFSLILFFLGFFIWGYFYFAIPILNM